MILTQKIIKNPKKIQYLFVEKAFRFFTLLLTLGSGISRFCEHKLIEILVYLVLLVEHTADAE